MSERLQAYTRQFIQDVLFSNDPPMQTPDAHADQLDGSIFQFFFAATDGWLRVVGNVAEWVNSSFNNRDIPHWRRSMTNPTRAVPPGSDVDFGESWPVIVAETLRQNGFISSNFSSPTELRDSVMELPDGRRADRLVFLNVDVAGGGVKRSFRQVKDALDLMSADNVNNNTLPGSSRRWNSLWDPAWTGLPSFLATPFLSADRNDPRDDGTYPAPNPPAADLRMQGLSILMHEFGHLALDLPDYYGLEYGPWGNMCIMGGPRSETHTHVPFSSLALHKTGYLRFTERSRDHHRLFLRPYETHKEAIRITNGAPGSQDYLIVTNRANLRYRRSTGPDDNGRGLLVYRWDPHRRTRTIGFGNPNRTVRKQSSIVRSSSSSANSSLLWTAGESISSVPPPNGVFDGARTLRNGRGELWFTVDQIQLNGQDLIADFALQAMHLLTDYHRASWVSKAPGTPDIAITPDRFAGPAGHVILQQEQQTVAGRSGKGSISIHAGPTTVGLKEAIHCRVQTIIPGFCTQKWEWPTMRGVPTVRG